MTAPAGVLDPNAANNSSTDVDRLAFLISKRSLLASFFR